MGPTGLLSTNAEIILLTITLTKILHIKKTDFLQALASDVHAKPNARGNLNRLACQMRREETVKTRRIMTHRQLIALTKPWVAADRRIVGKWRHTGHAQAAVGCLLNSIQPIVGDFSITIEQQHIIVFTQHHAAINRSDKPEILRVFQ